MTGRLTPADDSFLHQIPYTLDTVHTSDPDYRERMWMSVSDSRDRTTMVGAGIGQYINRNVQEAWAGVTVAATQHNFRASRHLRPAVHEMAVGPLRIETPEPLRRMRYVLEDNPSGIAFDIEFETTFEPHVEDHHLEIRDGKVVHDLVRYNIVGRASGTLAYPGGERRIDPEYWFGGRDHSWGVQPDQNPKAGQPTSHVSRHGTLYTLMYAQFDEWAAFLYVMERAPGIYDYLSGSVLKRLGCDQPLRVIGWEHEYRWRSGLPVIEADSIDVVLLTEDGDRHAFRCDFYSPRYFLRSALYMGWRGWFQGDDKGPLLIDHDTWDLADRSALPEYTVAGAGYDHHALCRSDRGESGHAAFEYFVTPGYSRYGDNLFPQR